MKLKKRQYRELMDRLLVQISTLEVHCLNHPVSEDLAYIYKNIQSAMFHLGSAHDQLIVFIEENEGKCDD